MGGSWRSVPPPSCPNRLYADVFSSYLSITVLPFSERFKWSQMSQAYLVLPCTYLPTIPIRILALSIEMESGGNCKGRRVGNTRRMICRRRCWTKTNITLHKYPTIRNMPAVPPFFVRVQTAQAVYQLSHVALMARSWTIEWPSVEPDTTVSRGPSRKTGVFEATG